MSTSNTPIGKVGRVTGRIRAGSVGEVTLRFGGGTYDFNAYPADSSAVIEIGSLVIVTDYNPDERSVTVVEDDATPLLADLAPPPV